MSVVLTLVEITGRNDLDCWAMPYVYAMTLWDAAIARSEASKPAEGDAARFESDEPVITPDGIELPPGMAKMHRIKASFGSGSDVMVVPNE